MLDGLANSTGTLLNDRKSTRAPPQTRQRPPIVRSLTREVRVRFARRRHPAFEYSKDTQSLKSPFKSLSLKKIKRRDTKTDEAVTEEKFALLLHTSVSIGDAPIHIYTYSIPLVVIVHGNQHAKAMATIVWDNYFGERVRLTHLPRPLTPSRSRSRADRRLREGDTQNRDPFLVPDAVPWSKMAAALSSHFGICNHAFLKDTDLQHLRQRTSGSCLARPRPAAPALATTRPHTGLDPTMRRDERRWDGDVGGVQPRGHARAAVYILGVVLWR